MTKKTYVKPTITTKRFEPTTSNQTPEANREVSGLGYMDAGSRFSNRRSVPRYPFSSTAAITEPLSGTRLSASVSEISSKGCYLELLDEVLRNTFIQISIRRNDATFESWARVAYVHQGTGSGIAFVDTLAAQQRILDEWIAEISAWLD
jgi:hypothetical protein